MTRGIEIAVAVAVGLAIAADAPPARADNVATLIGQLEDDSEKVRLSATLNLTKLGDARAIAPLAKRLAADSDKNVRGSAAKGLGQLVTEKVSASARALAVQALERAAADDTSEFVKAVSERALKQIRATEAVATPGPGSGAYVHIGPMSSKTGAAAEDASFRQMMVKVATTTLNRVARNLPTAWPGGGVPTKAALDQRSMLGFFVDGTLTELKIDKSGSAATISCRINMLLASFPDRSIFGMLNGGAKVQASSSARDIELAREDCVTAVVEDLIAKKIVPTIKTKAGIP